MLSYPPPPKFTHTYRHTYRLMVTFGTTRSKKKTKHQ